MFYCYKCRHCGNWQVKENRTNSINLMFKCQRCEKTTKILKNYAKNKGREELTHYGPFEAPAMATMVCKRIKLREKTGEIEVKKFDLEYETYEFR